MPFILTPTLAVLSGVLATLFIIVSVVLMLVILIQKPKGGGLSGAFGGAGGGQSAVFGAKTGDVLTWFTVGAFVIFLGLGIGLVFSTRADVNDLGVNVNQNQVTDTDPANGTPGTPGTGTPGTTPPGATDETTDKPDTPETPDTPKTPSPPDTTEKPDATDDTTPDAPAAE